MAGDVRLLYFIVLLFVQFNDAAEFELTFVRNPLKQNIVPPGTQVLLACSTNFAVDSIEWQLNHHPLPQEQLTMRSRGHQDNNRVHNAAVQGTVLYNSHYTTSRNADTNDRHDPAGQGSNSLITSSRDIDSHDFSSDHVLSQSDLQRNSAAAVQLEYTNENKTNNSGRIAMSSTAYTIFSYSNSISYLIVNLNASPQHYSQQTGIYQCIATLGSISLASAPSRLDVATIDPFSAAPSSHVSVAEEGAARIPCAVPRSVPAAVVTWYRYNQPLMLEEGGNVVISRNGDLLILNATADDAAGGQYHCAATNTVLNITVTSTISTALLLTSPLFVEYAPVKIISPSPGLTLATEGETVRLYCLVNNGPGSVTTWWDGADAYEQRDQPEKLLQRDQRESIMYLGHIKQSSSTVNTAVLELVNVTSSDAGNYTCNALVTEKKKRRPVLLTSIVQLYVQSAPRLVSGLESRQLLEGQSLELRCEFSGRPPPLVYWLNNGKLMHPSVHLTITADSVFRLQRVGKRHAGVMQCFAHNAVGSSSSHAFYTVLPTPVDNSGAGPRTYTGQRDQQRRRQRQHSRRNKGAAPGRPTVKRVATDAAQISWTQPRRHSHKLLFYKVQFREVNSLRESSEREAVRVSVHTDDTLHALQLHTDDGTVPAHQNTAVVTALTPGKTYKFRVAAVYSTQDSRVSQFSKRFLLSRRPLKLTPQHAPLLQSVQWSSAAEGSSEAMLSWQHQDSEGTDTDGFIISYQIQGSSAPATKLRYLGGERRSVTLNEQLSDASVYVFTLQAFNMAGDSPPSLPLTLHTRDGKSNHERGGEDNKLQSTAVERQSSRQHSSLTRDLSDDSDEDDDYSSEEQDYYYYGSDYYGGDPSDDSAGDDYDDDDERRVLNLQVSVTLLCVLLGVVLLLVGVAIYWLQIRRRNNAAARYGGRVVALEHLSTELMPVSRHAPADASSCLQALGPPTVPVSSSCSKQQQQQESLLSMPD
uniref:Interference hedgehog-like n=1 Tax=Hirondellea gigas TaxID=1518452 RepID=A0A6A7FTB9_9CRUS